MSVLFQGTDLNLQFFLISFDSIYPILFFIILFSLGVLLTTKKTRENVEDEEGSDYEDDSLSDQSEVDSDEFWLNSEESETDEEIAADLPFLYFSRVCRSSYFNEFRQNELSI